MHSLRTQLATYVLVMSALVAITSLGFSVFMQDRLLENRLINTAHTTSGGLARAVAGSMAANDVAAVSRTLEELHYPFDVLRVVVLDKYLREVAQVPSAERQAAEEAATNAHDGLSGAVSRALRRVYAPIDDITSIMGADHEYLGQVRVEMSNRDRAETAAAALLPGVAVSLVILCTAMVVTSIAGKRLLGHLSQVERAVLGAAGGDFTIRLPAERLGPFRAVGNAINEVGTRLSSMAASTSFINNVVQSMVDTLIVVDQQAKMKAINQATMDLLGYTEAELVGRTASLICLADGHYLTASHLEQLLGHGSKKDHEVIYIRKDGRRVPISLSGSAIKDSVGRTTGYVCIGTDIAHRKDAEAEREKLHKQLMTTSRQAGMAEVATGVLHNVGNVLNSVNVSASVVEETIRKSKVLKVAQVAELMTSHEADLGVYITTDEKGKMLPKYLMQLSKHLGEEQERLLEEVRGLSNHIGHIKDIISVQQSISKTAGVVESVDMRDLLQDALLMVAASLQRHEIVIAQEYGEAPCVTTDKHKVLQILVNLISNAVDAIKEAKRGEGRITLRLAAEPGERPGTRLEVIDNGVGIASENLTRIFTHGFTTKKTGHGFGLHSSALAAKELQGSLTPSSEGKGMGATFALVLPCELVETRAVKA